MIGRRRNGVVCLASALVFIASAEIISYLPLVVANGHQAKRTLHFFPEFSDWGNSGSNKSEKSASEKSAGSKRKSSSKANKGASVRSGSVRSGSVRSGLSARSGKSDKGGVISDSDATVDKWGAPISSLLHANILHADMNNTYPGYTGDIHPSGSVTVTFPAHDEIKLSYDLEGLEPNCTDCDIHVHAGTTCDDADKVGGHYFSVAVDPWTKDGGAVYNSGSDGVAKGSFILTSGYDTYLDNLGHAVVIHAQDGTPVSCGILEAKSHTPSPSVSPPTLFPTKSPSPTSTSTPTNATNVTNATNATNSPSSAPSDQTQLPTEIPSSSPTIQKSAIPTTQPSTPPSIAGSAFPSASPTAQPSAPPTISRSAIPSARPSTHPTTSPTAPPSSSPTALPSEMASTEFPTYSPTQEDTFLGTPDPTAGLSMDLFGLVSLSDADRAHYEMETASYIESFYNDESFAFRQANIRASVSNVRALTEVTRWSDPIGSTTGDDCSTIDPLPVEFSLAITYVTTDPEVSSDDIITYPFSLESFRQQYIDDYLKANDVTGGFQDLRCVSEVLLPQGEMGPSSPPVSPPDESSPGPTSENTMEVTIEGGETITPPVKTDIEMGLFGLNSLSDETDRIHYERETANYIESFYNDDATDGIQGAVSNVSTSILLTDQALPTGSTAGDDCSLIDPLTPRLSLWMTYTTTGTEVNFDDLITYPFSTEEFQQRYINDYLKVNDATGGFQDLQCVSEVRLPEGGGDEPESVPTRPPAMTFGLGSVADDSRLGITFSLADSTYERKCNDKLWTIPAEDIQEFEVSFVYGVESTVDTRYFIKDFASILLDFIAVSVLRCSGGSDAQQSVLRGSEGDGIEGVIRIRYPKAEEIATVSECEPTLPRAQGCAVLNSKLLVSSTGAPISEVHHDILMVVSDAFREHVFLEFIPELVGTAYLGPDPDALMLSAKETDDTNVESGSGSSNTVTIIISVCCAVLLVAVIACAAFPKARKQVFDKVKGTADLDGWRR